MRRIVPSSGDLLDANVWLALAVEAHTHHERARTYWEREAAPVAAFCRLTQMAFLRLLTNPAVMGAQVLTPSAAWAKTLDFIHLPEVELFDEPVGIDDAWERYSTAGRRSPNLWTDAYLAAFAVRAGLRLVSFDKGFSRFEGLNPFTLES
jgi:toxin-antitoxin system PIN domain toxin